MEATVTIICGTILALMQAYTTYRLKQQDEARDAARREMAATAAVLKTETLAVAAKVEDKVEQATAINGEKLNEIHVLVNTRMSEALERVQALEAKLGLYAGQSIPSPAIVTVPTDPEEAE